MFSGANKDVQSAESFNQITEFIQTTNWSQETSQECGIFININEYYRLTLNIYYYANNL